MVEQLRRPPARHARQTVPRRRGRWPRRVLIGVNVVVAFCLLCAALLYGYVRYRASQLKTAKCPSCSVATGATSNGLKPMNILLIGSNTRTGLDPGEAKAFGSAALVPGARSDVTMVLHLDPATGAASLLSIPRDLFIPLPAHSMSGSAGKIDAALNDGPNNLIAAITQDLGIPINHYVEINFDGFRRSIDAMGGINMSFPTRLRDPYSGLNITRTGCQAINGATALAVVRARHLQYYSNGRWLDDPLSDLGRIRRDHTFLRIFVTRAKAQVSNPLRLNALIGALLNQVTVDSGLNVTNLLDLFRRFRHLDPNTVPETTLPITVVRSYHFGGGAYGDVDMPVEPLDHQVINAWAGQSGLVTVPPTPPVRIVNLSGISHDAASVGTQLASYGYTIAGTSTGPVPGATTETVIRYQPGSVAAALGLLGHLSGAVMMAPDPTITDGSLTLDLGSVIAVAQPAPAASAATAPGPQAAPTSPPTSIPTALNKTPSSAQDQPQPFDPGPCLPAA